MRGATVPAPARALTSDELAVLRTVLYSSLFEYPVTLAEVRHALLDASMDEASIQRVYDASGLLQRAIAYQDGYFFPRAQRDIVAARKRREAISRGMLAANSGLLRLICAAPNTRLVAISGSAAHLNVDAGGDIDLFIITRGRRVWSAAVMTVLLTKLMGRRRMFCFNLLISDEAPEVEERDLFSANQIVHLRPLIGADVLEWFARRNPFVFDFYPGFQPARSVHCPTTSPGPMLRTVKRAIEMLLWPGLGALVESACRAAYSAHLRRKSAERQSPDQVRLTPHRLKLHTNSHRRRVLERFERLVAGTLDEIGAAAAKDDRP